MQEKKEISQKIVDYAIWYYLKYFPSINKLKQKLKEKFGPESEKGKKYGGIFDDDIEYIISEKLGNILCEKEIIISKINNYINKGKNTFYIKSKLYEKGFIKSEYEEILINNFGIDNSSILNYEKIYKQIKTLSSRNKSKNYIRNKFVENSFDAEIVDEILKEFFEKGEKDAINIELDKILRKYNKTQRAEAFCGQADNFSILEKLDFKEKQIITQKLVGKGFDFGEVIEILKS